MLKIKAAQIYVHGVKKIRIFLLGILFVLSAFVLLNSGLSLIHTALFSYSLWNPQVKFCVALILGAAELFGALGILFYLFKEKTWVKFCEIHEVINSVIDGERKS